MNLIILQIIAFIANYCDYVTTDIAINKYGLREVNPACRWLLKRPILFFLVKIVWVNFIIGFCPSKIIIIIIAIAFGLCALNNFINILKKKRRI